MEYTVKSAREFASRDQIEVWVQSYLSAGPWANAGLAKGLKRARRWWVGPVKISLDRLVRKCGPEPEMKYRMPQEEWDRRTNHIATTATDPELLPPAIAQWIDGTLLLADGNHRHEGARRKGWPALWVFIWFDSEKDWQASEWHPKK